MIGRRDNCSRWTLRGLLIQVIPAKVTFLRGYWLRSSPICVDAKTGKPHYIRQQKGAPYLLGCLGVVGGMKLKTCLTTVIASCVVGNVAIGHPNDGELEDGSRATIEIAQVREGEVLLRFFGDTATSPMVWASSDLRTWEKIGSATETESGEFLAVDVAAPGGASVRFYRAGYLTDAEDATSENEERVGEIREVVEPDSRSVDDGVIQTFSWTQMSSPITIANTGYLDGSGTSNRAQGEPDAPCVELPDPPDDPGVVQGLTSSSNKGGVRFISACFKVKVEGKPVMRIP